MARKTARKPTTRKKSPARKSKKSGGDGGFDWQNDTVGALHRLAKFALIACVWIGLLGGLVVAWYAAELPHIIQSTGFERKPAVTVLAADGSVIARYGELKGQSVGVRDLPPDLIHAVVAIEDRRFYKHHGIDFIGMARAMFVNVREGEVVQGGSTLTQQLAKNLFLTQDRTFKRKIQEALLALWLEHQLSKDEILAAYLNRVYMGSGAYGVEAASQVYFNKDARDLNLQESAALAGLLKAPTRYSPLANPQQSRSRTQVVLKAMYEAGYITQSQYGKVASNAPIPQRKPSGGDTQRYFSDWIMNQMVDLIGQPDRDLVVQTTLWPPAQRAAEKTLNAVLAQSGEAKNVSQGAVVMMDIDGAVHVMVGGRDYGESQFNRATQSLRQPGSSFKPFVYLTALENGWHANDVINDAPVSIGHYHPANYKNEYYGQVPLHFALAHSLNSAAIQLIQNVGPAKVVQMASNLGIRTPLEKNLSLALGTNGVPVLEMATAYATIANDGIGVDPYAITSIKDSADGTVLYERHAKPVPLQVADPAAVQELAGMMKETIDEGTGVRAQLPYLAAGKTGTSQDYRDAWFMGFSGRFATGVWVGNDDNSPMKGVTGGSLPAEIWKNVMLATYDEAQALGVSTQGPIQLDSPVSSLISNILGANTAPAPQPVDPNAAYVPPPLQGPLPQQQAQPQTFGDVLRSVFSF